MVRLHSMKSESRGNGHGQSAPLMLIDQCAVALNRAQYEMENGADYQSQQSMFCHGAPVVRSRQQACIANSTRHRTTQRLYYTALLHHKAVMRSNVNTFNASCSKLLLFEGFSAILV